MLANQATGVAPGAAGLRAEARGVRGEFDGQVGLGRHHIAYKVGQGHFAGRYQIERGVVWGHFTFLPAFFGGKQVALEFGQLPGAAQAFTVDDVRRVALGVAVLFGLHVQHELRQGAVQAGNRPFHDRES